MSQSQPSAVTQAGRLESVLAAYYADVDAGREVDWRVLAEAHPDLAADLERYIVGERKMQALVGAARDEQTHGDQTFPSGSGVTPTRVMGGPVARVDFVKIPERIADYELLDEIARGGMGVVYRARQISLNRIVAVKMVLGGPNASSEDLRRFQIEAEAAAQLDHPHIVPIHEVGIADGIHFFSMKLIRGASFSKFLANGQRQSPGLEWQRQAARMLAHVARAVHYAHQRGILHRDLKPGNILLEGLTDEALEGRSGTGADLSAFVPYITDFGLAKRLEADSQLTQTGAIVGTPSYMSPEQAMGTRRLDARTDIYSLGAILYQILTGRKPFEAETPLATIAQIQMGTLEPPSTRNRKTDRGLEAICLRCLEKQPRDRYPTAEALAEDLERWLRGEGITSVGWTRRIVLWATRHRYALITVYIGALLAAIGLAFWDYHAELQRREKEMEEEHRLNKDRIKDLFDFK